MNLNYDTYHIFENNGQYYMFDNEKLISCIIEKRIYNALNKNDISLLSENEIQMFEIFHKNNIFFVDTPLTNYVIPKYNSVIISMAVFHGCNLNCKYCFANAGENYVGEQRGFSEKSINAASDC